MEAFEACVAMDEEHSGRGAGESDRCLLVIGRLWVFDVAACRGNRRFAFGGSGTSLRWTFIG
jgi:hypothetical protein